MEPKCFTKSNWRSIWIGNSAPYVCPDCSAIVQHMEPHIKFHRILYSLVLILQAPEKEEGGS